MLAYKQMICLGVSETERNSLFFERERLSLTFFSPDTDVLVLIIENYDRLPKNTSISMASGVQQIQPLWAALGPDRAKALPGLHAFSGTDTTGRFARIGKPTWFKLFMEAKDHVIEALRTLHDDEDVSEDLQQSLTQFVCTAYRPRGIQLSSIPELRWHLFCKYMAESEKLPPTLRALEQHILRARVQARVWSQAALPQQELLDPLKNGYHWDNDEKQLKPTTTHVPPAPETIVEMVSARVTAHRIAVHAIQTTYHA